MRKLLTFVLATAILSPAAWANDAHHAPGAASTAEAGSFGENEGEIRKVDNEQGKLTIKHGALPNLGMPGMTMVFGVKDPAMLDQVAAGDQVKLQAEKVDGVLTVTQLERKN